MTLERIIDEIKSLSKFGHLFKPHKYLALLSAIDVLEDNGWQNNRIFYDDQFKYAFTKYFEIYSRSRDRNRPLAPYFHLHNSELWILVPNQGKDEELKKTTSIGAPRQLHDLVDHAELHDDLFQMLQDAIKRQAIKDAIIECLSGNLQYHYHANVMEAEPQNGDSEIAKAEDSNENASYNLNPTETKNLENPFVAYLNSLHSITPTNENSLAESQSTKQYFCYVHVPMKVADYIYSKLTESDGRHVILTGHAGDGKSTIGLELYKKFRHLPHGKPLKNPMREQEIVKAEGGYDVLLVKDMSELPLHERQRILNEAIGASNARFFIISNTGTLLETFQDYFKGRGLRNSSIENEILKAIDSRNPKPLKSFPFLVINLAQVDNIETAIKILDRMVAPELWECCNGSECEERCPIYTNVKLIQDNLPIVRERILLAYRRMVEYGERLTLRQISAHLAYMITSGLTCEQIAKFTIKPSPLHLARYLFFNRFFGDDGVSLDHSARQLKAIRSISNQEFGLHPCSSLERGLWIHSEVNPLSLGAAAICSCFEELRSIGAGIAAEGNIPSESARRQIRRMLYFLEPFDDDHRSVYIKTFLNSPMILDFVRWQRANGELSLKEQSILKARVMHVIQEHFSGVRLPELISSEPEVFITLNRHSKDIRQSAQIVLSKYHTDDFNVDLEPDPTPIGDDRCILVLKERHNGVKLLMNLPFLDYVMMRRQGEVGQILQDSYADRLERFKSQLLNAGQDESHGNIMLVRLRTNRTFRKQTYAIRDNKLEVLND